MANKNFKVKNNIVISELTTAGPVTLHSDGYLQSHTVLDINKGGTGQTTASNAINALLPVQTSASGKYLKSDGTSVSWETVESAFVPMPSSSINTNTTLSAFNKYFVNTSAARTLTLPASPSTGDEIYIYDASGTAGTYNITVNRNGNLINGTAGNLIIDVDGAGASLTYTGSTYGWKVG